MVGRAVAEAWGRRDGVCCFPWHSASPEYPSHRLAPLANGSREVIMPTVNAGSIRMNYEQQGSGEPLVLVPYLAADHACYAFQTAEYAKHFTCISIDPRGTGESSEPGDAYTTETLA